MLILLGILSASSPRADLLVQTDWLEEHLTDSSIRIVDMRRQGYAGGHIPGAVLLDNDAIRNPHAPPAFVPPPREFERLMGRLGISNQTRVIVYDDRGGIYAARLWWILKYYGHSNVALLDGGWTRWSREGRATSPDVPRIVPATFSATPDPRWLATAPDVVAAIERPDARIVDARTWAEIEGRDLRGIRRGGYIPSAVPVYWEDALDAERRTFKPDADLERLYRDRDILPSHEVVVYCQVGMRASHDAFVLHLLGYDRVRVYYGSWEEWGNRDDLPIATKPAR